jgi:uncharacterized membrane protein YdbT with pleckstrin-like domain
VAEITIRPTFKFVKAAALLLLVIVAAAEIAHLVWVRDTPWWTHYGRYLAWAPLLLPVVLLWPLSRWLRLRYIKAVIAGDRLRYETGMASKSTRNLQLSKVQDVRVDQSVSQRLFGVGDISIETAGETSRLTIANVDDPHKVADQIMTASQRGGPASA